MAMSEADVILAVGARFDDRVTNSDVSKVEPKQKQRTTNTSTANTKGSQLGIPDWLKKL